MKQVLETILAGAVLSEKQAYDCMLRIGNGEVNPERIVALMTTLQLRGLHLDELSGFRSALMELALPVHLEAEETIDVCGTGGDGKQTFNISTTTAFTLASMGYKVVKHGNYGVSSFCGSSTVLETLGYTFTNKREDLQRQLDMHNICFLHAPLFHPALKQVAPLRKALGIPTFFNGMGPLVNPANPTHQLTGTWSLELAKKYRHVLHSERKQFTIVHGMDGYDELTFTGSARVLGKQRDELITANPLGECILPADLSSGTTPKAAADLLTAILQGKGTSAQHAVVAGNTALAIQTFHPETDFETAFFRAHDHLLSGRAIRSLNSH